MTSDLDIYRSARLLVKQHGENAPIEAAMRVEADTAGGGGATGGGAWGWGAGALRPGLAAGYSLGIETGMTVVGGKADFDFGRLDVCL